MVYLIVDPLHEIELELSENHHPSNQQRLLYQVALSGLVEPSIAKLLALIKAMDDFAQSREPDDLFADEIEPTEQQVTESKSNTAPASNPAPAKPHSHQHHGAPNTNPNHRGGRRGGQNGGTSSGQVDQPIPTASPPTAPADSTTTTNPPATKPTTTTAADENRITSVRGDRSATGPAKPAKKTEAELTELMKSMQLKNAAKTEAHARAEKDQASFLQREQQAAAKRVEERKAIREQDMERAKNRERKIKAQGGREWDSEKVESDIVDRSRGGSSMYSRGAHGGVRGGERGGLATSRYGPGEDAEEMSFGGGRGGRGRGRGRGRSEYDGARGGGRGGRGRGGYFNGAKAADTSPPGIGESDFPALPSPATKSAATPASKVGTKEKPAVSPGVVDGDWADEMATPIEKN